MTEFCHILTKIFTYLLRRINSELHSIYNFYVFINTDLAAYAIGFLTSYKAL